MNNCLAAIIITGPRLLLLLGLGNEKTLKSLLESSPSEGRGVCMCVGCLYVNTCYLAQIKIRYQTLLLMFLSSLSFGWKLTKFMFEKKQTTLMCIPITADDKFV